ncbi:rRNA small subunit pseudouridine methyltransferase Nep1 [Sarracenia purpurea var. burkii]
MVRPFAMKGRKRKTREENYDREDTSQFAEEETRNALGEQKEAGNINELAGIPIQPHDEKAQTGAIFILEKASLEVAKVGKTYQLLNSDDHASFLRRNNKNPADYRPDIAHHAILAILDSPLNKAGRMRALYVRTEKGVLFEVKPHVRIPRTYKRFSGIMLQLLQKLSITAVGRREKLLRVIKNPVTQYLPINSKKIGFSFSSKKLVDISDYVAAVSDDVNFVFVVGAMAHGKIDKDYVEDFISISGYPLSAAGCINRICIALEQKWKIL